MREFGDVLQARRWAYALTIEELADRVGVSRRSVNHWLQGQKLPGLSHFARLVKVLDLDAPAMLQLIEAVDRHDDQTHTTKGT